MDNQIINLIDNQNDNQTQIKNFRKFHQQVYEKIKIEAQKRKNIEDRVYLQTKNNIKSMLSMIIITNILTISIVGFKSLIILLPLSLILLAIIDWIYEKNDETMVKKIRKDIKVYNYLDKLRVLDKIYLKKNTKD